MGTNNENNIQKKTENIDDDDEEDGKTKCVSKWMVFVNK